MEYAFYGVLYSILRTYSTYRVDQTEYYEILHTTASNRADHVHVTFFTFWAWGFGRFFLVGN